MGKKFVKILLVICIISIVLLVGISNMSGLLKNPDIGTAKNGLKQYNSAAELRKNVNFSFDIPQFLLEEDGVTFEKIYGNNVRISNDRFKFCVAKKVADDVSIIGNYDKFEFDKYYQIKDGTSSNIELVHYRTNGKDTIIEWFTSDLMYGLQMENYDGYNGYEAILGGLGINTKELNEKT